MQREILRRVKPFLDLLDARYLPLLFIASPQAYTVYRWLWDGSPQTTSDLVFAILGSIGFELVYVSVITWHKYESKWVYFTSGAALVFSVGIALRVYWSTDEYWSILHAGYPLISFFYSLTIHELDGDKPKKQVSVPVSNVELIRKAYKELGDVGRVSMRFGLKKSIVEGVINEK